MDDNGRLPNGVEFDAGDQLCTSHPEVWLDADEIREIREKEQEEAELKKKKAQAKKEKKTKKQKAKQEKAEEKTATPSKKKGIASKKNTEEVDEVTQIAASMLNVDENLDDILADDDGNILDFDFSGDDIADLGI